MRNLRLHEQLTPTTSALLEPMEPIEPMRELDQPFNYELLTDHRDTDGNFQTGEQLRTKYLQLTDELIRKMTDGVLVKDPLTHVEEVKVPDEVVFLDKSARPVEWLTEEMWDDYAPSPGEPIPPRPHFSFANIDRDQWKNKVDPNGSGYVDVDLIYNLDPSIIRGLRSLHISPLYKYGTDGKGTGALTEEIDTTPSRLDGKTVLIVDEVQATGDTLKIARKFFERAFPTAAIAGTHWMGSVTMKGADKGTGAVGNADLPVWYQKGTYKGRGVGNRDELISEHSDSPTQRLGRWFLSTRPPEADPASDQLRKEMKQLAHDPDVLVVPSIYREDDDIDARIKHFNGVEFDEFIQLKRKQDSQTA